MSLFLILNQGSKTMNFVCGSHQNLFQQKRQKDHWGGKFQTSIITWKKDRLKSSPIPNGTL